MSTRIHFGFWIYSRNIIKSFQLFSISQILRGRIMGGRGDRWSFTDDRWGIGFRKIINRERILVCLGGKSLRETPRLLRSFAPWQVRRCFGSLDWWKVPVLQVKSTWISLGETFDRSSEPKSAYHVFIKRGKKSWNQRTSVDYYAAEKEARSSNIRKKKENCRALIIYRKCVVLFLFHEKNLVFCFFNALLWNW